MVTNIPFEIVSHISLFNSFKSSFVENMVLLRQRYKLDAFDISIDDFIPLPDTSATANPYRPLPRSEKL